MRLTIGAWRRGWSNSLPCGCRRRNCWRNIRSRSSKRNRRPLRKLGWSGRGMPRLRRSREICPIRAGRHRRSRRPQRVVEELAMAKVARAIYSERQLQQVMDDFWFNHFNVFAGKGEDRWFLTAYEREVIQPHTLGKFKDLLTATAKSPAMLFYLDNFLSADPRAADRMAAERAARQRPRGGFGRPWPPRAPQQQQAKKNVRGLNENYGRELMELHTLGVDGGYTQKDVTEVARCFTGWSIDKPREYAD